MNYLKYIERAPENLQFFLWLRSYKKRFQEANTLDLALSPEWTTTMQDAAIEDARSKAKVPKGPPSSASAIFKGTDFASDDKRIAVVERDANPFADPSLAGEKSPWDPSLRKDPFRSTFSSSQETNTRSSKSYKTTASEAFSTEGLKAPCKHHRRPVHLVKC